AATVWESLGWWAYANGIIRHWSFSDNPVWFVVLLGLVPIWSVLYFGAGHWLLHRRLMYKHVHSWHHRNMNIGPWSGLSMHPLEQVILYSDLVLLLILPSSGVHMLFALMHHTIGAPMSHTGYDAVQLPARQRFELGDFHHQLHHRFIECNYGGLESPLDEMIGAFHDGTAEGDQMVTERLSRLSASRRAES
ncbi:MAG: sterol desaturase family protein, partial [Acidimicrobiaceae bacterium]|nr:sterol desaturase family protein [Acidimicrobiaceae bacterium]